MPFIFCNKRPKFGGWSLSRWMWRLNGAIVIRFKSKGQIHKRKFQKIPAPEIWSLQMLWHSLCALKSKQINFLQLTFFPCYINIYFHYSLSLPPSLSLSLSVIGELRSSLLVFSDVDLRLEDFLWLSGNV